MRRFHNFGDRGAIGVRQVDPQHGRESWGKIKNRDGPIELPRWDGRAFRDKQSMGLVLAGAAVAIFASNLADFLGAYGIDRRFIRPFHQKVGEKI